MIIDSQEYQNSYYSSGNNYYTDSNNAPSGTYVNNYQYSTIRNWLNDTFYETAFNEMQKEIIIQTTVDKSASTTNSDSNVYACENTCDKVWLMSYQDVLNTEYGFKDNIEESVARQKRVTAYAQSQGASMYSGSTSAYVGNGVWWLRSPYVGNSTNFWLVSGNGGCGNDDGASNSFGVCPCFSI